MNTINSLSRRNFLHLSAGACGALGVTSLGLGLSMPSGATPTKPVVPAPFDTIALSEIIKKAIANQLVRDCGRGLAKRTGSLRPPTRLCQSRAAQCCAGRECVSHRFVEQTIHCSDVTEIGRGKDRET